LVLTSRRRYVSPASLNTIGLRSARRLTRFTGWAISSGFDRTDIGSVADLKGGTIGVSRLGSGSYVMGFVLADQQGWLSSSTADTRPYPNTAILHTFGNLRKAVNSGEADFFMWEHFTSKRYYDSQEIKRVGEIYTPWSSWKIVTLTSLAGSDGKLDSRVDDLFSKLDQGIKHFNENKDDIVGRWRHLRCTVGMDNLDQTVDERVLLGETRPKISLMQAYLDCIATAILRRNMQIWSRPRRIRFSQNSD